MVSTLYVGTWSIPPRSAARYEHFGVSQNLAAGRIHSARGVQICLGAPQTPAFVGAQVRVPISELKSWLEEKLAY